MKKSEKARKRVKFQINTDPSSEVFVSGTFNDWNGRSRKLKDPKSPGQYSAILLLAPGKYEYKFVVNGEWRVDPECPDWVCNEFGTLNSLITVK